MVNIISRFAATCVIKDIDENPGGQPEYNNQ
jgi:hypothetical protein